MLHGGMAIDMSPSSRCSVAPAASAMSERWRPVWPVSLDETVQQLRGKTSRWSSVRTKHLDEAVKACAVLTSSSELGVKR